MMFINESWELLTRSVASTAPGRKGSCRCQSPTGGSSARDLLAAVAERSRQEEKACKLLENSGNRFGKK